MEIEIKVKIGNQEVTLEEARKIYDALKDIFEKKAKSPLDNLFDDSWKKKIGTPLPWDKSFPKYPYQIWPSWPYQPSCYPITKTTDSTDFLVREESLTWI